MRKLHTLLSCHSSIEGSLWVKQRAGTLCWQCVDSPFCEHQPNTKVQPWGILSSSSQLASLVSVFRTLCLVSFPAETPQVCHLCSTQQEYSKLPDCAGVAGANSPVNKKKKKDNTNNNNKDMQRSAKVLLLLTHRCLGNDGPAKPNRYHPVAELGSLPIKLR